MRRVIVVSLGVATGVTMLLAVFLLQNRIATLKTERAQVLARLAAPAETGQPASLANPQAVKQSFDSPAIELLRLRAEVTRLGNRKRELGGAQAENQRLQAQIAACGPNVPGAVVPPASYILKSQARNLGYSTPEATIETLLWAIQNRDPSRFLQAFDPQLAKQLETRMQNSSSTDALFEEFSALPGIHIRKKMDGTDGEVVVTMGIAPEANSQPWRLKQLGGQWKLVEGF